MYDPILGRFTTIDPLTENYNNQSSYLYAYNNPIRFTDYRGLGGQDEVKDEDDDEEDELEKLLRLIRERNIEYKEYDDSNVDQAIADFDNAGEITANTGGRPDLGFVGDNIRNRAGSDFSKDLFENYWLGGGDMTLSTDRFNAIANAAKKLPRQLYSVTLSNGQPGTLAIVNFYGNAEYSLAFGRATIYYNRQGQPVGFYDYYDFDPKAWGIRPNSAEIKTRMVNAAGALYGAQPYSITYGIGVDF